MPNMYNIPYFNGMEMMNPLQMMGFPNIEQLKANPYFADLQNMLRMFPYNMQGLQAMQGFQNNYIPFNKLPFPIPDMKNISTNFDNRPTLPNLQPKTSTEQTTLQTRRTRGPAQPQPSSLTPSPMTPLK